MDDKYGRLFTEKDVRAIVQIAMEQGIEGEDELDVILDDFESKFPEDEPIFLLRAQDYCSTSGIYGYQEGIHNFDGAQNLGDISQEHKDGVQKAINAFEAFQSGHTDRMKLPD